MTKQDEQTMQDVIWALKTSNHDGFPIIAWIDKGNSIETTQYTKTSSMNAKLDEVIDILDRAPICEINPFEFIDEALTKLKAMRGNNDPQ